MSVADAYGVAQIEIDTLTTLQKKYHHPEEDDEKIPPRFSFNVVKTPWSVNILEELTSTASKGGIVVDFVANSKFDYITYVYLTQKIRSFRIIEEALGKVEICLPHNLGHHITRSGSCMLDGNVIQQLDETWLDIQSQFFMKPGHREHYNVMIGNVPFLERWGDSIPEYTLTIPQPFYHCNDRLALPLHLESLSKVTYKYELRRKISDIVRMRVRVDEDSEWTEIPFNKKYIEGVRKDEMLELPAMWGRYILITDSERNWRKEEVDIVTGIPNKPAKVYAENIIKVTQSNTSQLGQSIEMQLNSPLPVKAIFLVAKNMDAASVNNHSNYTTNANNLLEGWNPISNIGLFYGGVSRIPDMDHIHFDMAEPFYRFRSPPCEPGYSAYSFGYDTTSLHADVGVVFNAIGNQAKISVRLDDTEPSMSTSKDSFKEQNGDVFIPEEFHKSNVKNYVGGSKYKVSAYLLVTTEIIFPFKGKVEVNKGIVSSEG